MYLGYMTTALLLSFTLTSFIPGYLTSIIRPTKSRNARSIQGSLLEFERRPDRHTSLNMFETRYLKCSVKSDPPAVIYWLKNGRRISNDTHNLGLSVNNFIESIGMEVGLEPNGVSSIGRSLTESKLAIRCAEPRDEGVYQCVADNGFKHAIVETTLEVVPSNEVWADTAVSKQCTSQKFLRSATITTWSESFVAVEGSTVRLFCRTMGKPKPRVTWYSEREGGQLCKIYNSEKYQLLKNGDLVIFNLSWDSDMGQFMCTAKNEFGTDKISTFVYVMAAE